MLISRKCHYALGALLELSRKHGQAPVSSNEVAEAQGIPPRFLEAILNQLAHGGFVASRRGSQGGYTLLVEPSRLTVGAVVRFIEGPVDVVGERVPSRGEGLPRGERAFMGMWERVSGAIAGVLDTTTFRELLDEEARLGEQSFVPSYAI